MVNCDNCDNKISFLGSKFDYEDENGNSLIYCSICNDEKVKSDEKEIEELIQKTARISLNKVQTIFENIEEKKFSEEVMLNCLKDEYVDYKNLVGYRSKVLKKLRELNIIKKDKYGFSINIETFYFNKKSEIIDIDKKTLIDNLFLLVDNALKINKNLQKENSNKKFICSDCEYKWESKKKIGVPFKCPSCNSRNIVSFKELKKILKNGTHN